MRRFLSVWVFRSGLRVSRLALRMPLGRFEIPENCSFVKLSRYSYYNEIEMITVKLGRCELLITSNSFVLAGNKFVL